MISNIGHFNEEDLASVMTSGQRKEKIKLLIKIQQQNKQKKNQKFDEEYLQESLQIAQIVFENDQQKKIAQNFVCLICGMIVLDPIECQSCDTLYCNPCIQRMKPQNRICVKRCQGSTTIIQTKEIDSSTKQQLHDLQFKCQYCNEVSPYFGALQHLQIRQLNLKLCEQGCGCKIKAEAMELHRLTNCSQSYFKCDECTQILNLNELKEHICIQDLKNQISHLKQQNTNLDIENKQLKQSLQLSVNEVEVWKHACRDSQKMQKVNTSSSREVHLLQMKLQEANKKLSRQSSQLNLLNKKMLQLKEIKQESLEVETQENKTCLYCGQSEQFLLPLGRGQYECFICNDQYS